VVGRSITPHLLFFDSATGALVADHPIRAQGTLSGVSSGAAIVDGTLVVGAGIGSRSSGGSSPGDFAANTPSSIVALCVPGSPGCLKPVLTPGAASVREGNKGSVTIRVPVELSEPSTEPVEVDWTTWDTAVRSDLAKPPDDYASASGTVVLAPGETLGHATIQVRGDRLHEGDELIAVVFGKPRNATLGGFYGLGFATIIDDDPPPVMRTKPRTVRETDTDLIVELDVRLSTPSGLSASAVWKTESGTAEDGSDFLGATGSVVFAPGQTRAVIPVTIRGDRSRERVERFVV